jgi:DNA-binding MarR family transcriptional regulator
MKIEDALKTNKFRDEKHKAILNILYTAYWLKNFISKKLKEEGITSEQYNVLRILKGKHPGRVCVKDIGERMIERSSNVPRILDKLILKELVKRENSEIDKRETLVFLTVKGIEMLDKMTEMIDRAENEALSLSSEDATVLSNLLDKVRLNEELE